MEKECDKCGYLIKNHKYKNDKYNCPEITITMENKKTNEDCNHKKALRKNNIDFPLDYICRVCFPSETKKISEFCGHYSEKFEPCRICNTKQECEHGIIKGYCMAKDCPHFGVEFAPISTEQGIKESWEEELKKITCTNPNADAYNYPKLKHFISQLLQARDEKLETVLNYNVDEPTKERIINALKAIN